MEYCKLNPGLEIWVSFFQINKGGKQGKKFIGYKNNIYEGKQDAIKEQMFSKVEEATGKLTFKSICYLKFKIEKSSIWELEISGTWKVVIRYSLGYCNFQK